MGKPSHTNPVRPPHRRLARRGAPLLLLCLAVCLAVVQPPALCQTQPANLPLVLPSAIVFSPAGDLYIADTGNHIIRKLSITGGVFTVAGNGTQGFSGDNGPAIAAELDSPQGLALDAAGNLYIADTHNHRVRRLSAATGVLTTVAGNGAPGFSGDGGPATSAALDRPTALAFDAAGNLYLADAANHRVRKIAPSSGTISTVAGDGIQGLSGDGGPATAASIDSPSGLAVDALGNLYLADTHNHRIRRVAAATGLIATLAGVTVSPAGLPIFSGDGGPASSAALALPRGLAFDAAGNLYLADAANHRIRRIDAATGVITTVAGQGTEAFAGDNGPAVAASLDAPRSAALSPAGLLTLADTANQRIRQLDALPAPGPDIHTIAGLSAATPAALSLTGPSVAAYGSASAALTATLTASPPATGAIAFLDTGNFTATTVGTAPLANDSATLSTAALTAGLHSIVALYAGDTTHSAAQSTALALTITPLALTAAANPASALYGQSITATNGALTGTLAGALPQDSGRVSPVFTALVAALSPVGVYPIASTLTGPAALDYTLTSTTGSLTIVPAPTRTVLSAVATTTSPGLPVTLSIQAASSTSGVPTGSVTLLDNNAPLSTLALANGAAAFTASSLALGSHSLAAAYSGDTNFLPSTSATSTIAVAPASDFTLAVTGAASQSVPAGTAAGYTFSIAMQGPALASPIALAAQGAPLGATVSFNPSYLPPGGAITSFTLTVQTPLASLHPPEAPGLGGQTLLAVVLLPMLGLARRRRPRSILAAAALSVLAVLAAGCGNRVNTAAESVNAKIYQLTVTGTATGTGGTALQHSAAVTLQVL